MQQALGAVSSDILYSVNNYGDEQAATTLNSVANTWRTSRPIFNYQSETNVWQNVKSNFLRNQQSAGSATKGHWNDPDILLIGNGLLSQEE